MQAVSTSVFRCKKHQVARQVHVQGFLFLASGDVGQLHVGDNHRSLGIKGNGITDSNLSSLQRAERVHSLQYRLGVCSKKLERCLRQHL